MTRTVVSLMVIFSLVIVFLASGCSSPLTGSPSFTLVSDKIVAKPGSLELAGTRDEESDTLYWAGIFFLWGAPNPNHEAALARLLERHQADVLLDAQCTTTAYGIPYIYMQFSNTVEGQPAKFVTR